MENAVKNAVKHVDKIKDTTVTEQVSAGKDINTVQNRNEIEHRNGIEHTNGTKKLNASEDMIAIEVKDVTKKYKVYADRGHTLKEKTLSVKRRKYQERSVLNGISFTIRKGEAVGLIGQNGCGKSTLLKLLAKIMYPDSGNIKMCGRVSSLIELGAGFHPDLSGRENIYINASVFGLTRKEIDRRVADIILFSELEEFIDQPVRTYSSGMYMRLAFAVAIHVDADILLIDEILAVGDAGFQAKCFRRMRDIIREGTTIVLVSHSLSQIEQLCRNSIWISNGTVREYGLSGSVAAHYLEDMEEKYTDTAKHTSDCQTECEELTEQTDLPAEPGQMKQTEVCGIKNGQQSRNGAADAAPPDMSVKKNQTCIRSVSLLRNGKKTERIRCGESVDLEITYAACQSELDDPLVGLKFYRNDGVICYGTNTQREGIRELRLTKEGRIVCQIKKMNLIAGKYWIDVALRNSDMMPLDYAEKSCEFEVYSTANEIGVARLDHKWLIDGQNGERNTEKDRV